MSNIPDEIYDLLADYCAGVLTEEDGNKLRIWIDASKSNENDAVKFIASYREAKEISFLRNCDKNKSWVIFEKKISKNKVSLRGNRIWTKVAATIIVLLSVSFFLWFNTKDDGKQLSLNDIAKPGSTQAFLTLANGETLDLQQQEEFSVTEKNGSVISKDSNNIISYKPINNVRKTLVYNTINIPRGGEYSMILSDGTQIWFNSETVMHFPVEFIGDNRQVTLNGEAYFKVAHNVGKPFIVNTSSGSVEVLGTSFNVSAYTSDSYVATTLVEGKVKVSTKDQSIVIEPGKQAVFNIHGNSNIVVKDVNTALYTSWVNGVFEFENANLEYICQRLERWYNVDFMFESQDIRQLHFTGAARRQDNIDKICSIIEKTTSVKFKVYNDEIRVMRE